MKKYLKSLSLLALNFSLTGCPGNPCTSTSDATIQAIAYSTDYYVEQEPSLQRFSSCQELEEYNKNLGPNYFDYIGYNYPDSNFSFSQCIAPMNHDAVATSAPLSPHSGSSSTVSENRQERDVQEADMIKTWNDQIFIARNTEVSVVDRVSLKNLGTFYFENSLSPIKLLLSEKLLIVLLWTSTGIETQIFSLSSGALPKPNRKMKFSGSLRDASLANNKLLLVLKQDSADPLDVPCDKIHHLYNSSSGARHLVSVHKIDLTTFADDSMGIIQRSSDSVYVTKANLYSADANYNSTALVKIGNIFSSESVKPVSAGQVEGSLLSEWSLKENLEKNYLAVATNGNLNNLRLLRDNGDGKLVEISDVGGFGAWESTKAVRYVGDFAYVVTFRVTDPLWAVDLSVPEHPVMVGKLMVPGFSSYLHPINTGKLVGVGLDVGAQVSLFDVTNPAELSRLDVRMFGYYSRSEAASDHRAFFYDSTDNTIAFPIDDTESTNCAVLMNVSGSKLEYITKFTHGDISYKARILRILKLNGVIYTLSDIGIKSHTPKTGGYTEMKLAL